MKKTNCFAVMPATESVARMFYTESEQEARFWASIGGYTVCNCLTRQILNLIR